MKEEILLLFILVFVVMFSEELMSPKADGVQKSPFATQTYEDKAHTSTIDCDSSKVCRLTNYCIDGRGAYPLFDVEVEGEPYAQVSAYPGIMAMGGHIKDARPVYWKIPNQTLAPYNTTIHRENLWVWAPAYHAHRPIYHLLDQGVAPIVASTMHIDEKDFSWMNNIDVLTLGAAPKGGGRYVETGSIPKKFFPIYRAMAGVDLFFGPTPGSEVFDRRQSSRFLNASSFRMNSEPSNAVEYAFDCHNYDNALKSTTYCFSNVTVGLPINSVDLNVPKSLTFSTRVFWARFRRRYLKAFCPASLENDNVHYPRLPRVVVISRGKGGLGHMGPRWFNTMFLNNVTNYIAHLQNASVIGESEMVRLTSKMSLGEQGCFMSQFDVIVAVHGNAMGWLFVVQAHSMLIDISANQADLYQHICDNIGIQRIRVTSSPPKFTLEALKPWLTHAIIAWKVRHTAPDYIQR